jgi:Ca2+-binding EF-hand superfamily protein
MWNPIVEEHLKGAMLMNVSSVGSSSHTWAASATSSRNFRTQQETISKDDLQQMLAGLPSSDSDASSFLQSLAADFESADSNGDGLSASELQTYAKSKGVSLPQGPGHGTPPALSKNDLTKMRDEIAQGDSTSADGLSQVLDNFDDADTDQDGALSMSEMQTYTKANNIEMPKPGKGGQNMPPPDDDQDTTTSSSSGNNRLLKMLRQMAVQTYQSTASATSATSALGVSLTA